MNKSDINPYKNSIKDKAFNVAQPILDKYFSHAISDQ